MQSFKVIVFILSGVERPVLQWQGTNSIESDGSTALYIVLCQVYFDFFIISVFFDPSS